jgi:hypothetical protein
VPTEVVSKLKNVLILAGFLGSNDFYAFGTKAADNVYSEAVAVCGLVKPSDRTIFARNGQENVSLKNIRGAYCVFENRRGNVPTLLTDRAASQIRPSQAFGGSGQERRFLFAKSVQADLN